MTCMCGHKDEEHQSGKMGRHECEAAGCDCFCFDEDTEDTEDTEEKEDDDE